MQGRDRRRRLLGTAAVVVGSVGLATGTLLAATSSTTFDVQAQILSSCAVSGANLSFGNYDASSASVLDASSTLSVNCTQGTAYVVKLDVGSGGGSYVNRTMANGANVLAFNLYRNAARSEVWGDESGATLSVSGTGSGLLTANSHTVYGRVPIGQDEIPGTYSSTITVTVEYN